MGNLSTLWQDIEASLQKGDWGECIRMLEDALPKAESAEDIASIARRLSQLFRYESSSKNEQKASQYAFLAGEAYVVLGRMAPAVAMLNVLKDDSQSSVYSQKLHRRISETFSLPGVKRQKGADEHLPPPTPYRELKGVVTFENDDDLLNRMQWSQASPKKMPLFSWLRSSEVYDLVHMASLRELSPRSVLFREGDRANAFYFVAEGEMELSTSTGVNVIFKEGDCFGEIALLGRMPRTATLKTTKGAKLLEFSERALRDCFQMSPQLETKVMHFYELRLFLNAAARHPLFRGFTQPDLEKLWDQLTTIRVPQGRVLFEGIQDESRFYLLTQGKVEGVSGKEVLTKWGPGHFIGPSPSLSKVVAATDCHLLECHRLVFEDLLKIFPQLKRAFDPADRFDFFAQDDTTDKVIID